VRCRRQSVFIWRLAILLFQPNQTACNILPSLLEVAPAGALRALLLLLLLLLLLH
jgi:hypothetical protein